MFLSRKHSGSIRFEPATWWCWSRWGLLCALRWAHLLWESILRFDNFTIFVILDNTIIIIFTTIFPTDTIVTVFPTAIIIQCTADIKLHEGTTNFFHKLSGNALGLILYKFNIAWSPLMLPKLLSILSIIVDYVRWWIFHSIYCILSWGIAVL